MLLAAITLDIGLSQQTLSCEAWRIWMGRAQGYYGRHIEPIACTPDPNCGGFCVSDPKPGEAVIIKLQVVDEHGNRSDAGDIEWAD